MAVQSHGEVRRVTISRHASLEVSHPLAGNQAEAESRRSCDDSQDCPQRLQCYVRDGTKAKGAEVVHKCRLVCLGRHIRRHLLRVISGVVWAEDKLLRQEAQNIARQRAHHLHEPKEHHDEKQGNEKEHHVVQRESEAQEPRRREEEQAQEQHLLQGLDHWLDHEGWHVSQTLSSRFQVRKANADAVSTQARSQDGEHGQ
mmetsp:Transcript_70033/g.163876  ORF Transcript_70033/g.163876 Transcript_70033/m.163876 type:complete len:200 (+) Transcript_70033:647-1246(+)